MKCPLINLDFRCDGCNYNIDEHGNIVDDQYTLTEIEKLIKELPHNENNKNKASIVNLYNKIGKEIDMQDLFPKTHASKDKNKDQKATTLHILKLKSDKPPPTNLYVIPNNDKYIKVILDIINNIYKHLNKDDKYEKIGVYLGCGNAVSIENAQKIKANLKATKLILIASTPVLMNRLNFVSIIDRSQNKLVITQANAFNNPNAFMLLIPREHSKLIQKNFDGHIEYSIYRNGDREIVVPILYKHKDILWLPVAYLNDLINNELTRLLIKTFSEFLNLEAKYSELNSFLLKYMKDRTHFVRKQLTIVNKMKQVLEDYQNTLINSMQDKNIDITSMIASLNKIIYVESFKYDELHNIASYITRPVIIKYEDTKKNLGRFSVKIDLANKKVDIRGYDNNSGYPHPHISRPNICWGGFKRQLNFAFAQNNILFIINTVWKFLNSYNAADKYRSLHEFRSLMVKYNQKL